MNVSGIRDIYAYSDGDVITPNMGVSIDSGYGLFQFWDSQNNKIINTDFTKHNAKLFPQAYSSAAGKIIVPDKGTWHLGSPTATALAFDASGKCTTSGYQSIFKLTTIAMNGVTQPCLVIIGNLATATSLTDKHIYYVGEYDGRQFTCHQTVTVQVAMGDSYDVVISAADASGNSGDYVISNDTDVVKLSPYLYRGGLQVTSGVTYTWERMQNGVWKAVTNQPSFTVLGTDGSITIYRNAVDGIEYYRVTAVYQSVTVKKVQQVNDETDPYYIDDGCDHSAGVRAGETVTFTPKVYNRHTNKEDKDHTWSFAFTVSDGGTGDVLKTATGTLSMTYDQIKTWGGRVKVQVVASCTGL